jgi:hypothetical protein
MIISQKIRLEQARQKFLLTVLESFLRTMGDEKKTPIYSADCNPPFTSQGIGTKVAASN